MRPASKPVAIFTALVLAIISLICVSSCTDLSAPVPPCHQHHDREHQAKSCAPLLLTAESPSHILAHAVPALPVIAVTPTLVEKFLNTPADIAVAVLASPPPINLRI